MIGYAPVGGVLVGSRNCGRKTEMKIWLLTATVLALVASLIMNGGEVTVAIVVNLAIWGILGVLMWSLWKYVARGQS